ncbi:hypothetical protein NP493_298g00043 [Ridgeia piscesae]|uniref:Uncharacterized protein n=1 Tax=Ridgeia piscesae TaxID=27915 RepID=A0AAD9L6F1_RIDPI|nr:hypothetical protein NP493_298g00043 [Ridgeia piscesae]
MTDSSTPQPDAEQLQQRQQRHHAREKLRHKVILGLGIVLGVIGASLMVLLGVLYVGPYVRTKSMRRTTCTATSATHYDDTIVRCSCASDGCRSSYPCLKVLVNFTTTDGEQVSNATLYNSLDTYELQGATLHCSYHKCSRKPLSNVEAINAFAETHGNASTTYHCYYDPADLSYSLLTVVGRTKVVHCMLWPALSVLTGLVILLVYVLDVNVCRSRRQTAGGGPYNSLDRPWLKRHEGHYERVKV